MPLLAPWHPAGAPGWEIPIKWTSYGPNVVSTQKAKASGYSDALLLSRDRLTCSFDDTVSLADCHVLDGPNFAIAWISTEIDNTTTLHMPDWEALGLLPSITQSIVADIADSQLQWTVRRGVYKLQDVFDTAREVMVMSTTRGVIPVTNIGGTYFSARGSSHDSSSFDIEKDAPRAQQLIHLLKQVTE